MALRSGNEERKKGWRKKRIALVTLSILLLAVFCSSLSSSTVPSLITPAAAVFSSITITDVRPTEFSPGETSEVLVTVKNNGGRDARDIRVAFQGTDNLSLIGATVVHINTLNSWSSKEIQITVHVADEAPNGAYAVPVTVSWREYYFDPAVGDVTVPVEPAQLGLSFSVRGRAVINVGAVTTDPTDIRPGEENIELRVFIENSGEAAAKDIEAQLLLPDAFSPSWSGTDRSYLGRLNSGEKSEAVFTIDLADSVPSGTHRIPVRIQYKDTTGSAYEVIREVMLLVKPKPDFAIVSYYTEPASINAATPGVVLHVQIKNIGTEKTESVSVRMTGEADVPFDYDVKSDFVGNLEIGDAGEAIMKFDVNKDAVPKVYPLGIEIRCTGDRGIGDDNVYLFNKELKVEVSSSGSQQGNSSLPGFEALFSILALLFVFIVAGRLRNGV